MSESLPQLDFSTISASFQKSSSEARHVKTHRPPTRMGKVSTASGPDCSSTPCGWCEKCDRLGHALRTSLASELVAMTGYTMNWKRQAMKSGRSWWVLGTPVRHIDETVSGLLPSPRKSDADRGGRGDLIQAMRGNPNKHFTMPTPRSCSGLRSRGINQTDLTRAMLPTPRASEAGPDYAKADRSSTGMALPAAAFSRVGRIGTAGLLTLVEWMMGFQKGWLGKC